jgi:hypothetical protein
LRNGLYELFGIFVALYGSNNFPRFLRLVADALEDKPSKCDLTPIGLDIVKAWWAGYRPGRTGKGFDPFVVPELLEIKTAYALAHKRNPPADLVKRRKWIADLQRSKRIPSDQTFRKTLKRVKLPYR